MYLVKLTSYETPFPISLNLVCEWPLRPMEVRQYYEGTSSSGSFDSDINVCRLLQGYVF